MRSSKEQIEERELLAKSGLKRCSEKAGCGQIKSVDEFGANKGRWDNKQSICRICNRNKCNQYNNENREASKAYARQYYLDNPEAKREYRRKYYAKQQQEDPLFARLHSGELRAKKAGAEWQRISSTDLLNCWEQNNMSVDTCHYCKQTIDEGELEIDHGIPLSRGGGHSIDNLFPSHRSCNREKKDKTTEEYLEQKIQKLN